MTAAELKRLLRTHSENCFHFGSTETEKDRVAIITSGEALDTAIEAVFTERDYARYMCDAIRREFGAGLDDPKPFVLPWEKKT